MSSYYLAGAATTTATYGFDLEIELLKSTSASVRASSSSSSSLNSSLSESSNSLSAPLSICTRKPRTPRKRQNQTYNEAAALLSTAYPNIFSPKHLTKPSSFKFSKPIEYTSMFGEEILLPDKPFEPRLGMTRSSSCSNISDKPPIEENRVLEDDDFNTESILDEEIGGIDSIMGKLSVTADNNQTSKFCYGIPMGLGLGLMGGRFDFGFGMTRGVRAFRNSPYRGSEEWWKDPAMTTVDIEAISPRPEIEKKKTSGSSSKKKKKKVLEEKENGSIAGVSISDRRIQLKLNYDDVLSSWSDRGSPFSHNSQPSEFCRGDVSARLAQIDLFGERESSVELYKDKRRSRVVSRKIQYQVRKVDATDQRPRVKAMNKYLTNEDREMAPSILDKCFFTLPAQP